MLFRSMDAKNLIKGMLKYDPVSRISAKEAFNNKWIKNQIKKTNIDDSINASLKNLSSFNVQSLLQQLTISFIANRLQTQEEQKRLRSEFLAIDVNGDGLLQKEELISGYIKLGKTPSEANEIVNKILAEIDTNNNGTIDLSEFLTANLKQQETVADNQLIEAFKLFDKVIL